MKAALFWLCLFVASLASIEGRTLKNAKPVKYNFKLSDRIETLQRNEKTKKEKNIRCYVVHNPRTVRCSLVKKCPNDDPSCRTSRQVHQTLESAKHENKIQKASTERKAFSAECSDKTNPLCIHDIWVGKRSYQNPLPKKGEHMRSTLCSPDDEMCLSTIRRADDSSKAALENDKDEVTTDQEEKMMNGINLSSSSSSSRPGCDFIRDPNCKPEGSPEKPPAFEDVLKRLQANLPTSKRQKCKTGKGKICRWRPQPINDIDEEEKSSKDSDSGTNPQT